MSAASSCRRCSAVRGTRSPQAWSRSVWSGSSMIEKPASMGVPAGTVGHGPCRQCSSGRPLGSTRSYPRVWPADPRTGRWANGPARDLLATSGASWTVPSDVDPVRPGCRAVGVREKVSGLVIVPRWTRTTSVFVPAGGRRVDRARRTSFAQRGRMRRSGRLVPCSRPRVRYLRSRLSDRRRANVARDLKLAQRCASRGLATVHVNALTPPGSSCGHAVSAVGTSMPTLVALRSRSRARSRCRVLSSPLLRGRFARYASVCRMDSCCD